MNILWGLNSKGIIFFGGMGGIEHIVPEPLWGKFQKNTN